MSNMSNPYPNPALVIKQSRWKSPVFWSMLSTQLIGLLTMFGFWEWVGVTESFALKVAGLVIAIVSGVINGYNNPENKNAW